MVCKNELKKKPKTHAASVSPPVTVMKFPAQSNLKKEGFPLAHSLRAQPIVVVK